MPKLTSPNRGFTIIELLVVITVITVLIALLSPALSKVRERSQQIKCSAIQRGMTNTFLTYDTDYKAFPNGNGTGQPYAINSRDLTEATPVGCHVALRESYGLNSNATVCPSASTTSNNGSIINYETGWKANGASVGTSYYYLAGNGGFADTSATINGWSRTQFDEYLAGFYPAASAIKPYKLLGPQLLPSQQFMLFDYNGASTLGGRPDRANHPGLAGTYKVDGQNVSFMDGHVEWQVLKSKVSWALYGAGGTLYWTPSFGVPGGVTVAYLP